MSTANATPTTDMLDWPGTLPAMCLIDQQAGDAHIDQPLPQRRVMASVGDHRPPHIGLAAMILQQPVQRIAQRISVVGCKLGHAVSLPGIPALDRNRSATPNPQAPPCTFRQATPHHR